MIITTATSHYQIVGATTKKLFGQDVLSHLHFQRILSKVGQRLAANHGESAAKIVFLKDFPGLLKVLQGIS